MTSTNPEAQVDDDWYAESFGHLYPTLYAHRTIEAARPEAGFAAEVLKLGPQDQVLDLCCGTGRHMIHLLEHTGNVTGLDYSPELLHIAQGQLPVRVRLVRGDMRMHPFQNTFDVVTNFFTSFGYFEDDEENASVIRQIASSLRPNGRVYMDYLNPTHLRQNLDPSSKRRAGEYTIIENRWVQTAIPRVKKTTEVWAGEKLVARLGESVRMYALSEMQSMYESAGLTVDAVYGNHTGARYAHNEPRMILVARKVR